jgi:sodium-independent sulfate anion transporter 11
LPTLFSTRAATYKVIINTLKGLPRTKLDAAFGLTGLASLYIIRFTCDWLARRYPKRGELYADFIIWTGTQDNVARVFFFVSVFRNAFVIIILTLASWLFCRHHVSAKGAYPIKILLTVPSGLRHVGPPDINPKLLSAIAPQLPAATIILLLEHIAIAKCMHSY